MFNVLYQKATWIYGLIHARYIQSTLGLIILKEKYLLRDFGICPRELCKATPVFPFGPTTKQGESQV